MTEDKSADKPMFKRPRRESMSRVDTAWLRMERPTNPMMITGVLMFDEPISLVKLKKVIERRFLDYSRFRMKPVETPGGMAWQTDDDFDLDWHVRLSALPGRGDQKALERFVSALASSPRSSRPRCAPRPAFDRSWRPVRRHDGRGLLAEHRRRDRLVLRVERRRGSDRGGGAAHLQSGDQA